MGKRESKDRTQHKHALRRARERFDLGADDVYAIERMIRNGHSQVMERQSLRRVVHCVNYHDTEIFVVYDTKRSQAATFLYPEGDPWTMLERGVAL